ncbi:aspartic proteinase nepenthesin-1-like [Triticum aestivum]|nr:aspartic proteinase nepenthesin-1-like [Triticum aestivum]
MEISLVLIVVVLCASAATLVTCSSPGFHMQLRHVDGKGSYTAAERVQRAMASSRQRLATFVDVTVPVHWNTSQYIAEYLIGTPPQRAEALIDTGSDLIWTQCSDCSQCVKQGLPHYNASMSNTFHPMSCNDALCLATQEHSCRPDGSCTFRAFYGAGDASGTIDTEVFAFQNGSARLTFGCVESLMIAPGSLDGASGLIGLGRGPLSLVSQAGANKFSYCHTPYLGSNATIGASSHLFVGALASLSGDSPVMSMSFVQGPKEYPFYYVPLVGISVGQTRLPIPPAVFALKPKGTGGGVIVDSGTPTTGLAHGAYGPLREELQRQLNGSLVPPPADSEMDLCVAVAQEKKVPSMVLHFSGRADMVLPPENYWVPLDSSTSCMVMDTSNDMTIIGNFQLQNIHLLYDLAKDELSFQTADCSKL